VARQDEHRRDRGGWLGAVELAPRAAARCWPGYPACQLGSVPAVKT